MSRRIVGPFNRVEGDLEIKLEIADGVVREAWVNSPLYRGFEQILLGKDPTDALVYTPRICGICSVSQSLAAAATLASVQGLTPPPNGALLQNLILAAENAADHLTHFYLFYMPDFARPVYAKEPWHAAAHARFKAIEGTAAREMLPARAQFMHLMGTLAGRWPRTLGLQPGGTTRAVGASEQARVLAVLAAFRRFLEASTFADTLERIAALDSEAALDAWAEAQAPTRGDFRHFLHVSKALGLDGLGKGTGRFLSYGAYTFDGRHTFKRGVVDDGRAGALDPAAITEDPAAAWLMRGGQPSHPSRGVTLPDPDAPGGYSWCKAPRLAGAVVEVGALARQVVDGHALIVDLVAGSGGNARNRVIARLIEIARIIPLMEDWARSIRPREPCCHHGSVPAEAEGEGLIEAARGSLGHWLHVRHGRILNYQIIAPTTWNFSPRDGKGQPGVCEQALVGAPVRAGEVEPVAVQHIVRSFDPCMVCTVH
ncbi:MAG: nickel-dependent hydrogenase large subunit [Hyphomicrobiaceae bacterium]|nr:MAG: nickel-dependent hydrogenase large subunit [Hyphomicrobiaceae bacterium]